MRILIFASLILLTGCATYPSIRPLVSLAEVERPASARERYGEYVINSAANDSGVTKYTYRDQLISATFFVGTARISMDLENLSEHSIRVLWGEAVLIPPGESPSPVMHLGVKYNECRAAHPPTVVPRGTKITDFVVPCSRVSMGYQTWDEAALLGGIPRAGMYTANIDSLVTAARERYQGKQIGLLLPLQIEGVTNEYTFRFAVDSILKVMPPTPGGAR